MIFKKNKDVVQVNDDLTTLLRCMDKIIEGDITKLDDTVTFTNPAIKDKYNQMIDGFKKVATPYTMRLNDSMEVIGNCEIIKEMIEQVESQTSSITNMSNSSQSLGDSINSISGAVENIIANTNEATETAKRSCDNMRQSIEFVSEATESMKKINEMILSFKEKTDQINDIITIVKSIAKQSGLLALNASIEAARAGEAGKGFAVVANEVKELSNNTSASTEDVVKYVTELQAGMDELVSTIEDTSKKIIKGNDMVANSVSDVARITDEISAVNEEINSIYNSVETQSVATNSFVEGINNLSDAYKLLLDDCMKTGALMHKISRSVDTCRSDMARGISYIDKTQWVRIFEIDHLIFTWRQYNSLQGYEKLPKIQKADECKLGKWAAKQTDPTLINSDAYKDMLYHHDQIHKKAQECWDLTNAGNKAEALKVFNVIYSEMQAFLIAINKVKAIIPQCDIVSAAV